MITTVLVVVVMINFRKLSPLKILLSKQKMMFKKKIMFILASFIFISCNSKSSINFYSPDKTQSISVIDEGKYRYVFNGNVRNLQKVKNSKAVDYVKLDVSGIAKSGDALFICWENEKYKWELLCPNAVVVKNKLDLNQFNILTKYTVDKRGIPIVIKYHGDSCFDFDFESKIIFPKGHALMK